MAKKTDDENIAVVADDELKQKTAKTSTESRKKSVRKADFCVYIGPTILGVIQSGTIYEGSTEDAEKLIAPAIERYPDIKYLLANDCDVAVRRKEIKTEGNFLHKVYRNVAKKQGGN